MTGVIRRIITLYEMRADSMSSLVTNTQKVLEQFNLQRQETSNQQTETLDSFVKNIVTDLYDMLTRFRFQTEHIQRKNKQMTAEQVRNLADFVNFTKTLAGDMRALSRRLENTKSDTFEERFDREIKQMETYVKRRLKHFGKVLDGTDKTLSCRLSEYFSGLINHLRRPLGGGVFSNTSNTNAADSSSENCQR